MNNKYAIFYKTDKNSYWQSKRLTLSLVQWEDYADKDLKRYNEYVKENTVKNNAGNTR